MTAQIPETVRVNGRRYDLCGIRGDDLFDPAEHDIVAAAPNTACWRGFVCGYKVRYRELLLDELNLWSEPAHWSHNRARLELLLGDKLEFDDARCAVNGRGIAFPIRFTGNLLIGRDFIEELYVHMGFHPAYKYREVLELAFEKGRLLTKTDLSEEMEEIRLRKGRGDWQESGNLAAWIDDAFRLDY